MDFVRKTLARVRVSWQALDAGQRLVMGGLVAAVALAVLIAAFFMGRTQYTILVSGLEPTEAAPIVDRLRDLDVSHQLVRGGTTILVPESKVNSLRVELAEELPITFDARRIEALKSSRFGPTRHEQYMLRKATLESELARTISELSEVKSVAVHLVIPEKTGFLEESERSSAAVKLHLKAGAQLQRRQIAAISALVAGAVEGLDSDDVTIVDNFANLLAGGKHAGLEPAAGWIHELEEYYNRQLEAKVRDILDHVVGPGRGVVIVTAELDRQRIERDRESFDPEGIVRSEQTSEDTQGGINETKNYDLNRTFERILKQPGNVKRLNVSVTVDGRYEGEGDELQFVERDVNELQKYSAAIRAAVGINAERGDQFNLTCVRFDHRPFEAERQQMQRTERWAFWTRVTTKVLKVVAVLAFLLLVAHALRLATRTLTRASAPIATTVPAGRTAAVGAAASAAPARHAPAQAANAGTPRGAESSAQAVARAAEQAVPAQGEVLEELTRDPKESAGLLRAMLQAE